jgi:hypothetical protein
MCYELCDMLRDEISDLNERVLNKFDAIVEQKEEEE